MYIKKKKKNNQNNQDWQETHLHLLVFISVLIFNSINHRTIYICILYAILWKLFSEYLFLYEYVVDITR